MKGHDVQRFILDIQGIPHPQFIGVFIGDAEADVLSPIGSSGEFDAMNFS
jgi:hypothetical protein